MPLSNVQDFKSFLTKSRIIQASYFAVDVFFFLSGFLGVYLMTLKLWKTRGRANYIFLILHRYIRLVPGMLFMIMLTMWVLPYIGNGVIFWKSRPTMNVQCKPYWWTNALFINNFYPPSLMDNCMFHTWYLANDFQFFLLTPPLVMLYCRNRKLGYYLTLSMNVASMALCLILTATLGITINKGGNHQFSDLYYSKPWTRWAPYGWGCILGFMWFEYKQ